MNVLVTGCAGFIGWKTTALLLAEGHSVIGVDNLDASYDVRIKKWRLADLRRYARFRFFHKDITDLAAARRLFSRKRTGLAFDAVINLAAKTGVRSSVHDPWAHVQTNVVGTLNLLECGRISGVKKFILASTSSIYGRQSLPFREDSSADLPCSPYAASKRAAEAVAHSYQQLYGLDITVLRYFTVYGPAGRPDMSVFRFIRSISEGEPLAIYGDGKQERDFTYVDDIARGTVLSLRPVGYEVINLGSGHPVRLLKVVKQLEDIIGKPAQLRFAEAHPADVPATWADVSKARRLLGWRPRVSLAEGLKNAVAWYLKNRAWASRIT